MKTITLTVVALFINVYISACKTSNDSSSKTKVWGSKNSTSSSSGEAPPPPPSVTERVVDLVKTRGIDFPGIVTRLNYFSQEYSLEPVFKQELEPPASGMLSYKFLK